MQDNNTFEKEVAFDAKKTLAFKVKLSLSDNEFSIQLSNKKMTFDCSVNSVQDLLAIGSPTNCDGKSNLRVFFNSCKALFSKPSNSQQHLGYFFFNPKNVEEFSPTTRINSLPSLGTISSQYSPNCAFLYLRFTIFDSLNDESFSFYLALKDLKAGSEETVLEKSANLLEKRFQTIVDSLSHKISALTRDNEYWIKMYLDARDEIKDIKEFILENGGQLPKEKETIERNNSFFFPKSYPFVFGILSRCEDTNSDSAALSSQLGTWSSSGAENMAAVLCGTHSYGNSYVLFRRPPGVEFLQGSTGTFLYKEQHTCNNGSANYYQYPRALLGAFFIRNPKTSNQNFTLSHGGTSSWSSGYEGASVFLGTPDHNDSNRDSVSSVSWSELFSYTQANENLTTNTKVTVPANKTVCLLIYTTPFYQNTSYNFNMFSGWKVFNLRTALQSVGLELDHELTLKAVQCQGVTNFHQLWHK